MKYPFKLYAFPYQILEPRFQSETLAMLLNIPPQKTLLRRHLATNFNSLVGPQAQQEKQEFANASGHAPLTTTAKVRVWYSKQNNLFYATYKMQVSFLSCCIFINLAKEAWFYSFPTTKKAQNGWISRLYLPHGYRDPTNPEWDTKEALWKLQGHQPHPGQRLRQTGAGWV